MANLISEVAPIVDENDIRYLGNCYIDQNNQGYFKLDEIFGRFFFNFNKS